MVLFSTCKKYRPYLLGWAVTIYIDAESLTYLYSQPTVNSRKVRWLQEWADFTLKIVYLPGLKDLVADALSRQLEEAC